MSSDMVRVRKAYASVIFIAIVLYLANSEPGPATTRIGAGRGRGTREKTGESDFGSGERAVAVQLGTERRNE